MCPLRGLFFLQKNVIMMREISMSFSVLQGEEAKKALQKIFFEVAKNETR